MVSISKQLHIVALPFPAQGHMSQMLHLSKQLAAQGLRVSYFVPSPVYQQMKDLCKFPEELDIHLESYPFERDIPHGMNTLAAYQAVSFFGELEKACIEFERMFERFAAEGIPVSCIISDCFLPGVRGLSDKTKIHRVGFWPGGARWAAFDLHASELHNFNSDGSIDLPGLPALTAADVPFYMRFEDEGLKKILLDRSHELKKEPLLLVNSFQELEELTLSGMKDKFLPVGPLILIDKISSKGGAQNVVLREEKWESIEWLDKQKKGSALYISFGSLAPFFIEQFEELAAALVSAGHPFLWVVRSELFINFDDKFKKKYQDFVEQTKEYGMIISWGPQLQILQHESIGGFLTHCGWNSTIESICNGVPLIGWPWSGDQNINCGLLADEWKIGVAVPTRGYSEVVGRNLIVESINKVMNGGDEFRANVDKVRALAIKAAEPGGQSSENLNKFIKDLKTHLSSRA